MIEEDLARAPLFHDLPSDQLAELAAIVRQLRLPAERALFSQGDAADAFYVLVSGRVKVFKVLRDGRTATIRHVNPGETFGESALFAATYPAHAETMMESSLYRVPKEAFLELLARQPQLARNLLAAMARLMVMLNQRMEELLLPVPARLARYLLSLREGAATESETGQGETACLLPITKRELAARLGTVPETLSRTLNRFARARVVRIDGQRIVILDLAALERLAQEP